MQFPSCAKVLVIDDKIEEAMPLLTLLGKKGVSAMYYSGNINELPETPFDEIRLVFCDLKFNVAPDEKSVASNVTSILNALISSQNGPYILVVWSAHCVDYVATLNETLSATEICPEFVLQLSKGDFFSRGGNEEDVDRIIESVSELELDPVDEERVKRFVDEKTTALRTTQQVPVAGALAKIEEKLAEELKKANLMHLFVLWENAIGTAAIQTVNNIYRAIPDSIPKDKKLRAMLFYLANHRLEKQMNDADESTKFEAAMASLNEMFVYFFSDYVGALSINQIGIDKIQSLREISELSPEKFNRWKMISMSSKGHRPGNVYEDPNKHFEFHGLLVPDAFTAKEKYDIILDELEQNTSFKYILIDVSSECDIAQRKIFLSRVVPGVMMPSEDWEQYCSQQKVKSKNEPDYIFKLFPVEYKDKSWCFLFNVNQLFSMGMDALTDDCLLFTLTSSYISNLKQKAAFCVSKQGIEMF